MFRPQSIRGSGWNATEYENAFGCDSAVHVLSLQSGMMIAPVLANLGPLEELAFKPNPEEVQLDP